MTFTPRTRAGIIARVLASHALSIPGVARLAMGSTLRDDIELPDYAADFQRAAQHVVHA